MHELAICFRRCLKGTSLSPASNLYTFLNMFQTQITKKITHIVNGIVIQTKIQIK